MYPSLDYKIKNISSWNRSFSTKAKILYPKDLADLKSIFKDLKKNNHNFIIKTGDCSYDDKSIPDQYETFAISLKNLNRIISLNKVKGNVSIQTGALFPDIIKKLKDKGCTLYSVPGGSHISIGGAIAANVIGKDSSKSFSCFGDSIESIDILNYDGSIKRLKKSSKNFLNHIGSFGLYGTIISVKLKIKKIKSQNLNFSSKILTDLNEVEEELEKKNADYKYIQIDPFFRKNNFAIILKGVVSNDKSDVYENKNLNSNIFEKYFFYFISFFINRFLLKLIYKIYFQTYDKKNILMDISNFHYPSKYIHLVPLLCRKGIVDYEILIKNSYYSSMSKIINFLRKEEIYPIYMITKKLYKSKKKFSYQFSDNGYSVAMAFDVNNFSKESFKNLEKLFSKSKFKLNQCKNRNYLPTKYDKNNFLFKSLYKKRIMKKYFLQSN